MVFPDVYIDHSSAADMYADAGLTAEDIVARVLSILDV
jgi:deoxyxylulose-5-phosphate synthase